MSFSPRVGAETTGKTKIVELSRGFSIGSSVFAFGQHASFSVFFNSLNFQVLEHVDLSPRDQLIMKILIRIFIEEIIGFLTLAGGHVNGFSPRLRATTVVMKRSSTGNDAIRLPLKSKVVSCRYDISAINKSIYQFWQQRILMQKRTYWNFLQVVSPQVENLEGGQVANLHG